MPRRIDSHLETFDCITCDKCLPVCPNAANFTYPTPKVAFDYFDLSIDSTGNATTTGSAKRFEITETIQIACYAEFCNHCGNCDTFCPEYGGPYIKKPTFHGSLESWQQAAPRDGFFVLCGDEAAHIYGRIKGQEYELFSYPSTRSYEFRTGRVAAKICADSHTLQHAQVHDGAGEQQLDLGIYHTLRYLLEGITNRSQIHQVNCAAQFETLAVPQQ